MDEGRSAVKAVSTVIATVVVLTVFIGLASAIYTGLFQLSNESSNLVKREVERAMEAFFRIYWLNETHVVLFNNHTSVPVTLLYWVTTDPVTGNYSVHNLNPAKYTVPPATMRIVENFLKRGYLHPVNRVVSEKGSSFEVTDAPTDINNLIYFTPSEKIVRPGFDGRLTTFIIPTGPDFGGGEVTITCVAIINTATLATIPCTTWSINFAPAGTVTVPPGGVRAVGVNAIIPPTFTSYGFYAVKLRLTSASFTREYATRVIVTDFSASISPGTLTLGRLGCALPVTLSISFAAGATTYTGHININVTSPPPQLLPWASPNPVHPPAATIAQIIVERVWAKPLEPSTDILTVTLNDGLGTPKTLTFTVVHTGETREDAFC